MSIIGTLIIGFVIGLVARAVMPGDDSFGIIVTTILGIAGAFVGSFIGQTMGWAGPGQTTGIFGSVMGALIILFLARVFTHRSTR